MLSQQGHQSTLPSYFGSQMSSRRRSGDGGYGLDIVHSGSKGLNLCTSNRNDGIRFNRKNKCKQHDPLGKQCHPTSWLCAAIPPCLTILFFITGLSYRASYNTLLAKIDSNAVSSEDVTDLIQRLQMKRGESERIARSYAIQQQALQLQVTDLQELLDGHKNNLTTLKKEMSALKQIKRQRERIEILTKRENAWSKQAGILQRAIKKESHRELLETFGPGPHKVKFVLEIAKRGKETAELKDNGNIDLSNVENVRDDIELSFIVEMAPIDLMPHAVHIFLEQVHHKLWDDTFHFATNANHVLVARPQGGHELALFRSRQLETLAFPEYSKEYPHSMWTIGFPGRDPIGPHLYINKENNEKDHGPGGQQGHALVEQADPCFGRVIDGFKNLEQIFALPTRDDGTFVRPVKILSARLL